MNSRKRENNSNITLQRVLLSTLNCHVAMETPCNLLKKGDTLEDVEVVRVTKRGVYIALDNGIYNPGSKIRIRLFELVVGERYLRS